MKIASNKIGEMLRFYRQELTGIYEEEELEALIDLVFYQFLGFRKGEARKRVEDKLNQSELIWIYDTCKALKSGRPIQYILGEAEFYNLPFIVNQAVLIPRPETEELVDIILKEQKGKDIKILDIGTGSGCIPVTLKKHLKNANIFALDVSEPALNLARRNANHHQVQITFFQADILKDKLPEWPVFDVIISNPPYINIVESKEITTQVIDYEPHLALFVEGNDDTIFYKKIIDLCEQKLNSEGVLYFELNPLTASDVEQYAKHKGLFSFIELRKDMSGKIRFFKGVKN